METRLLSEKKDGYIVRRIYSCPCGKSIIEEETDYTPGHKDTFVSIRCPYCRKHYSIQYGTHQSKWRLYHDYTTYYKKDALGGEKDMKNLAAMTFSVLRDMFFDEHGNPVKFDLREKRNTQDDPFDEYISAALDDRLRTMGARCQRSSGPLISPDMAVYKIGVNTRDRTLNTYTHLGLEDAAEELRRMEEAENARREQEKLAGKTPSSQKMFKAI